MERLAGRADAGQQRAVYVRLRLLQGALSFHQGELPLRMLIRVPNPDPNPIPDPNPNPTANPSPNKASCMTRRACCAAPRAFARS